jgi:ankyrin repeat protein
MPRTTRSGHGRLDVFRILIEHDADINLRNNLGEFAIALNSKSLSPPWLPLDYGADRNVRDHDGSAAHRSGRNWVMLRSNN